MHALQSAEGFTVDDFLRDGVVVARNAIAAPWLDLLRQAADDLRTGAYDLTGDSGDAPQTSHFRDNCWCVNADVRRFVFESGVADLAAGVLQSAEVHLYGDGLFRREPGTTTHTPWHQDEQAWPVTGRQMCSVWLSTESVTPDTGALRFVVGSHRGPLYTPAFKPKDGRTHHEIYDGDQPDVASDPDRFPVTSFHLEPSDALIFHPRMLHSSFGSAAEHPRRSFTFRFLGDDVRWRRKEAVFLDDLLTVPLEDGDMIQGERFPLVWSSSAQR